MEAIQRFEKPGLYRIVNIASSTALDLSSDNATIQGWYIPIHQDTLTLSDASKAQTESQKHASGLDDCLDFEAQVHDPQRRNRDLRAR